MSSKWKRFSELMELSKIHSDAIRVDTRDFSFTYMDDLSLNIHIPRDSYKNPHRYYYDTLSDAIEVLKDLHKRSGGDCEWRCLEIKGIYFLSNWTMKYLTITNVLNDKYLICCDSKSDDDLMVISKHDIKLPLNEFTLNAH